MTDEVKARFGGHDLVFKLPREKLPLFENSVGKPAQLLLRNLSAGLSTVNDIATVLEASAPRGWGNRGGISIVGMNAALTRGLGAVPLSKVEQVLRDNPPMKYAVLAQGVLAAALHGLPINVAVFDENEEVDDDAA